MKVAAVMLLIRFKEDISAIGYVPSIELIVLVKTLLGSPAR